MTRKIFCFLLFAVISSKFPGYLSAAPSPVVVKNAAPNYSEVPAMRQLFSEILDVVGDQAEFELREADVLNLEASFSNGKMIIRYNEEYVAWLNNVTRDKWAVLTLLAHEIGHHLKGHTKRRSGSKPRLELQADEYAGYVLFQLGATLEQTQEVMYHIARIKRSRTHPPRSSRLDAIEKGWLRAAAVHAGGGRNDTAGRN